MAKFRKSSTHKCGKMLRSLKRWAIIWFGLYIVFIFVSHVNRFVSIVMSCCRRFHINRKQAFFGRVIFMPDHYCLCSKNDDFIEIFWHLWWYPNRISIIGISFAFTESFYPPARYRYTYHHMQYTRAKESKKKKLCQYYHHQHHYYYLPS